LVSYHNTTRRRHHPQDPDLETSTVNFIIIKHISYSNILMSKCCTPGVRTGSRITQSMMMISFATTEHKAHHFRYFISSNQHSGPHITRSVACYIIHILPDVHHRLRPRLHLLIAALHCRCRQSSCGAKSVWRSVTQRYETQTELNACSRVLLDKLTVTQLVKKLPAFYGNRRFITVFTTARHWSLYWARWILSTPSQLMSLRNILTL
jgi:hypothetical protein